MFKAYASSESSVKNEDEKEHIVTSLAAAAANSNSASGNTWLENRSFSIEPPTIPFQQQSVISTKINPPADFKPKEEKKPISKPIQNIITNKTETKDGVFYIDRRRDRANTTVQYTHGVPRYGAKFCNQRPLGSKFTKFRKQRLVRYFHHKTEDTDNRPPDSFVTIDDHLKQLNITVREQPQSFDAWKELIDYQFYLFKTNGQEEKLTALYNKQLSIVDRALELNDSRLQYRLLKLNIRSRSNLFNHDILLNEWLLLIKDCQKSSDDRTINETWFSYIQFILNRIEIFSIDKLNEMFTQYFSTYAYHIQTRSEKDRKHLLNHMIEIFQIWTCTLRDAGYCEQALALYQTMIELHLDLTAETKINFSNRLETIEKTWDTDKRRFGEHVEIENPITYIENELLLLSTNENRLFNSTYQSWILIEQARINFYQSKILNHGIHFHSKLLQSLSDSSQIDNDISNILFQRSIRPFVFELNDQRQFLQIIIYYLYFLNGLPQLTILQEVLNKFKISLSHHLQEQLFIDNEFLQLYPLIHSISILRTESNFSIEYISKVYEQIIAIPSLKSYQIEFILLHWYYLAENIRELKQQNPSLAKARIKSLQTIIKKYLSLEEYRTCLRLYTHYGRVEYEYFQRINESRRIFDLCFQTIQTNPTKFSSFDSYNDVCYWLSTSLICEFNLNHLFDNMLKIILENSKLIPLDKQINNKEKLCSSINYVLNKLFPNTQFNDIIILVIDCLKSRKFSKWDQKSDEDWSTYLRKNIYLSFELLFIFLNYSYLLNDPFDKLHSIILNSIVPLINEQRNKTNQTIIDYILRFYLSILWNELFTEHLLFNQCTNYLKQLLENIKWPSNILLKFISIYTCFLPLYGSYVNEYEQKILSYEYTQKIEYRLITKMFVLEMNLIRHLKIQKASSVNERINSGYEHRVRHILKQLIQEYPYYVQIWLFYEHFEKYSPNSNRIKSILYDAMQSCPWAKTLYMKSISSSNNDNEWKLFLNVMLKSNVHILFSLEEFDMLKELCEMKT
ncbi:unnamed protein product [Rotaria socialis]|uniref:Uncharacterized protein n=1 Tax=Rotaria socialis TaxID=392032 RepID=A0A819AG86_9BILA|nr:unnamed protein product [Rotaria socialis]CAF4215358.1 unnamed protein product [Rotaria socialis]